MLLPPGACRMGDIHDAEAFVIARIRSLGLTLTRDQHEELIAEGLAILTHLHHRFDGRGRFSGYSAKYLPGKLLDAWHKQHPEHHRVTNPATGKREWVYLKPAISIHDLEHAQLV